MDTDDEQEITAGVVDNKITDSDKMLNDHMDMLQSVADNTETTINNDDNKKENSKSNVNNVGFLATLDKLERGELNGKIVDKHSDVNHSNDNTINNAQSKMTDFFTKK